MSHLQKIVDIEKCITFILRNITNLYNVVSQFSTMMKTGNIVKKTLFILIDTQNIWSKQNGFIILNVQYRMHFSAIPWIFNAFEITAATLWIMELPYLNAVFQTINSIHRLLMLFEINKCICLPYLLPQSLAVLGSSLRQTDHGKMFGLIQGQPITLRSLYILCIISPIM